MKCTRFVVDSTTHITASYPFDSGNSTTKSTLTTFHQSSGIGSGWSSPTGNVIGLWFRDTYHKLRSIVQQVKTYWATNSSRRLVQVFSNVLGDWLCRSHDAVPRYI